MPCLLKGELPPLYEIIVNPESGVTISHMAKSLLSLLVRLLNKNEKAIAKSRRINIRGTVVLFRGSRYVVESFIDHPSLLICEILSHDEVMLAFASELTVGRR